MRYGHFTPYDTSSNLIWNLESGNDFYLWPTLPNTLSFWEWPSLPYLLFLILWSVAILFSSSYIGFDYLLPIFCRRLVLTGRGFNNSVRSFSSVVKKDPSLSKLDCRPLALQARVDFLIRLGDLDTAAKHARLSVQCTDNIICINQTCQAIIGAMCEAQR